MKKDEFLRIIGASCRRFRRMNDYPLWNVALDCGVTPGLVSHFERGVNNNAFIFSWYLSHGFDPLRDVIDPRNPLITTSLQFIFEEDFKK